MANAAQIFSSSTVVHAVVLLGVVLRVDSPGGDALASDLMWREIRMLAGEEARGGVHGGCGGIRWLLHVHGWTGEWGAVGVGGGGWLDSRSLFVLQVVSGCT